MMWASDILIAFLLFQEMSHICEGTALDLCGSYIPVRSYFRSFKTDCQFNCYVVSKTTCTQSSLGRTMTNLPYFVFLSKECLKFQYATRISLFTSVLCVFKHIDGDKKLLN